MKESGAQAFFRRIKKAVFHGGALQKAACMHKTGLPLDLAQRETVFDGVRDTGFCCLSSSLRHRCAIRTQERKCRLTVAPVKVRLASQENVWQKRRCFCKRQSDFNGCGVVFRKQGCFSRIGAMPRKLRRMRRKRFAPICKNRLNRATAMQCCRAVKSHAGKSLRKTSVMYGTREETATANTKSKSLNLQPC